MNSNVITALFAVAVMAIACNAKQESKPDSAITQIMEAPLPDGYKQEQETQFDKTFAADTLARDQEDKKQRQQLKHKEPAAQPEWDKKIIKTAILNAEVKDYYSFYTSIRDKVKAAGGYVAQEEQTQSDYKIENSLTIKVPVDQFDNAVAQLVLGTEKINEKKISSQDVTAEMIDTKSRMEAKKQVRLRYIDLLKQAKNMEEILNVQSEINGIQEQIESAAGRIQFLGHSSTFSTIHLTYYQVLNVAAKSDQQPSFGTQLIAAFKTGSTWIRDLLIGLVAIWPLFFLIFISIIIYKKRVRKLIVRKSGGSA